MATVVNLLPIVPKYLLLLRSQYASRASLEAQSRHRIEESIRAAFKIPFYREHFGAAAGTSELRDYPILRRSNIPALNRSVREAIGTRVRYFHDSSSGSTGMPVEFLFDGAHQSGRYAARIRYLRASGWSPLRRNAWIVAFTSRPHDNADSQLIFSRLRLRSTFLKLIFQPFEEQVDALLAMQPEFLYTMPSNLDGLLQVFERRAIRLASLRCIFSGGEVLDDAIRDRARHLLGVEIRDNYGSTEGFVAWQCPARSYHINSEHVAVEIVDHNGTAVAPGQIGRILITTLENRLMPLIRYEIGDYGVASNDTCGCGRTLPVMGKVIGRGINLFRMRDGRLKSPWPLVGPIKARREIRQFQIVQETHHRFVVRYVSDRELDPAARGDICRAFGRILEIDATVSFERTDAIARTAGGKFMTALSRVSG
jgi:phenylacetate-CoA ligase